MHKVEIHKSKLSNCIVQVSNSMMQSPSPNQTTESKGKQNGLTKVTNYPKSCPKDVKIQKYKILSQGSKAVKRRYERICRERLICKQVIHFHHFPNAALSE